MGKLKTGDESTDTVATAEPFKRNVISVDEGNGIVVVETDAPDGTGFSALIDGDSVDSKAESGQIWFYVGRELRTAPIIELK